MFYCDPCAKVKGWPANAWVKSYGPCEVCGVKARCNDVPSRDLPRPAPPEEPCGWLTTVTSDEVDEPPPDAIDGGPTVWTKACNCNVQAGLARIKAGYPLTVVCPECGTPWTPEAPPEEP